MDVRREAEDIMWQLIRLLKTQKAVAKALGKSKQTFNYWLNYANRVPYDQVLQMKALLEKLQNKALASHYTEETNNEESFLTFLNEKKDLNLVVFSGRVRMAMALEQQIKRARSDKKQNPGKLFGSCPMWDNITGRIDTFVAKRFSIGSKNTYHRAKQVMKFQMPELIQAMDSQLITVHHAAQLTKFPSTLVQSLILQGKKAINDFLKRKALTSFPNKEISKNTPLTELTYLSLFQHTLLREAEQHYCLPLRLTLIGLLLYAKGHSIEDKDADDLKALVLPFVDLNFSTILEVLCLCGFLRKTRKPGKQGWQYLLKMEIFSN